MHAAVQQREHLRLCEAPEQYPISKGWLAEHIRSGRIRVFKPSGRVTLIRRADLVALLESTAAPAEAES